jgi:hypothetical protein
VTESAGGSLLRKFLIGFLFVIVTGSMAAAQSSNYVGLSTGLPLTLNAHYGAADVFGQNTDLRILGRVQFIGVFGLSAVADVIHHFRDQGSLSAPYAGGGVGAGFATASSGGMSVSAVMWDIHGLGGYLHQIDEAWGVFGEMNLGVGVVGVGVADSAGNTVSAGGVGITYALRLGVNYSF